jgi:hypothetical protein
MNQGGGLLSNIPQGALLGAALYGQGIQGKDPVAGFFPAYMQTAQARKLLTPKIPKTKAVKDATTGKEFFATDAQILASKGNLVPIKKAPLVKIEGDTAETAYQKARGGQEAKYFGDLMDKADLAQKNIPQYDLISAFSQNLNTGFAGDLLLDIAKFGKRINVDLDWLTNPDGTLKEGIATAETVQVLGVQFALDKIQRTKGAVSDREFKTFINTSPALSMSPEGIQLLNTMNKRLGQRDIEVAALAQEWESNYGRLDKKADTEYGKNQSFNQFLSKWKEDPNNNLFDEKFYERVTEVSSGNQGSLEEVTKVIEGARYRRLRDGTWIRVGGK